ncbi:MAG: CDP-glucose 4,6-dehydratase [Bacteroidia bacterium]
MVKTHLNPLKGDKRGLFGGIYKNKKVLVTGFTGFKGSWLCYWLEKMGADVYGYALEPPTRPNHIDLLNLEMDKYIGDVRDAEKLHKYMARIKPDIVFHLAAQSLVRASYVNPAETFSTNVMGTLNVFEACRKANTVNAIVNVTSDKCYENREWIWGYRENDAMGGYDPYSASKGCAELLTASFRNSFFNPGNYRKSHYTLLASARAGNVIGGGDWAADRLIADIAKATSKKSVTEIRNPKATRPWQHVLEPLSGYLTLGWRLLEGKKEYAEGWNFGPDLNSNIAVEEVVNISKKYWPEIKVAYSKNLNEHHEANLLMLDCSKVNKMLKWKPVWGINDALDKTINWYKNFYGKHDVQTETDLNEYIASAVKANTIWTI